MLKICKLSIVLLLALALAACAARGAAPTLGKERTARADELYSEARHKLAMDDCEAGEALLVKAVKAGSPQAAFALSHVYERKYAENPSAPKAKEYKENADRLLHEAAGGNYAPAQYSLATRYKDGDFGPGQIQTAVDWYKRAALNGSSLAQFWLGYLYNLGEEVPLDYAEAAKWYQMAADQGEQASINNLAIFYCWGQGVPQDWAKGIALFESIKGTDSSDLWSYNLGVIRFWAPAPYGDKAAAVKAFRAALGTNDGYAESALGEAYAYGWGVKRDFKQAFAWFIKSAEMGYPEGQYFAGEYYRQGKGVKRDFFQAAQWLERSAAQNDSRGLCALGKAYDRGEGVIRHHGRAMELYLKAAARGEQEAMYLLGEAYQKDGNHTESRAWYKRAADYTIQEFRYGRPYDPAPLRAKALKALGGM